MSNYKIPLETAKFMLIGGLVLAQGEQAVDTTATKSILTKKISDGRESLPANYRAARGVTGTNGRPDVPMVETVQDSDNDIRLDPINWEEVVISFDVLPSDYFELSDADID